MAAMLPVVLAGCASQSKYIRTDGASIDMAQEQAMLAQCKGEGAIATPSDAFGPANFIQQQRKEVTIIDACMARNGYIHPQ
jgi:hypothetical protein